MEKKCCDVLDREVDINKDWFRSKKANGEEWIPAFITRVDPDRCVGCGMCVKVCLNNVYEMQIVKGKKVAVAAHPKRCFGDCHCHKVCPVFGGAMICKPKLVKEMKGNKNV